MVSIIRSKTNERSMRLCFHHVCYLRISKESLANLINEFIKNKVSVVLIICSTMIINQKFPIFVMLFERLEILFLSIFDTNVKYFSIDSISKCRWNSSFSILDQKWLIIIWKQFFSKKNSIINKLLFIINSNLS